MIRLVTYYSVKGQEFQHVLLWGVDEGMIPLPNSDDSDLEKQRKLFYVAITRASDSLSMFVTRQASRFLLEIEDGLMDYVKP